ncbi:cysteine synthase A [Micromonospora sediminicola]|uniref:Cysteine synthase A n=1 Tax=Micromonospora sediminicola TaxID=946078 RepID=A0A1A9B846_9ACTN|nr:pyridoxal-phosphate dependent enzyme [Micromonospora sediminicola]SBT65705.1 cysteine synthase A [Micromonospora sediminicola]
MERVSVAARTPVTQPEDRADAVYTRDGGPTVDAVTVDLAPHLVPLGPNLWGASFRLMKMLPAHHILTTAVATGEIGPDTRIVESTSGTFGLALAMKAALIGRPLTLVTDPAMDQRLCRRVADLGATVEMCATPSALGEFQTVRLARLAAVRDADPDTFWPRQYDNPLNPDSYGLVADHLVARLGGVDALIGPVGSGGSMCGTALGLRARGCPTVAIAVDTPGSVLFGQPDRARELRGLGNSVLPGNLDHTVFDEVHWCPAAVAYRETRRLHRRHALFHGPTSGAAMAVARWWSARNPRARTVVMLPDQGDRYLDTVYDDGWLAAAPARQVSGDPEPREVGRPEADPGWTWLRWGRRPLADLRDEQVRG